MFKSRPLLMLITGLILAFVLWGIVQLVQRPSGPVDQQPDHSTSSIPSTQMTEPQSVKYANAPASILSAVQKGASFTLRGTGVPGAGISVQSDTREFARAKVSGDGQWTLGFTNRETDTNIESEQAGEAEEAESATKAEALILDVLMVTPDGHQIRSDQSLIIVENMHQRDPANREPEGRKSLLLLTAPGAHSRVLQSPYAGLPQIDGFTLEAIDYDNSGGVIFSGSSDKSGKVRIYAGENMVGESHVDSHGRWSLIFGNIMPLGEYMISAELVLNDSRTVKLTLPFARMQPLFQAENSPKILVEYLEDRIQLGRALFGGGYQYSVIYAPTALED